MEKYKDIFDMSGCKNLCDFVQKNVKCSEREALIFISIINFFDELKTEAILDGYEWTTDRLYDSVIDALETATATELGLI